MARELAELRSTVIDLQELMQAQASSADWNRDGRTGPVEGFIGGRRTFVKDVLVNVLANLLAGAVIYLGAVAGGYIQPSWFPVAVATVIAAGGVAIGYLGLRAKDSAGSAVAAVGLSIIAVALAIAFTVFQFVGFDNDHWISWLSGTATAIALISAVLGAKSAFRPYRNSDD